jgi:hypothetical protein
MPSQTPTRKTGRFFPVWEFKGLQARPGRWDRTAFRVHKGFLAHRGSQVQMARLALLDQQVLLDLSEILDRKG